MRHFCGRTQPYLSTIPRLACYYSLHCEHSSGQDMDRPKHAAPSPPKKTMQITSFQCDPLCVNWLERGGGGGVCVQARLAHICSLYKAGDLSAPFAHPPHNTPPLRMHNGPWDLLTQPIFPASPSLASFSLRGMCLRDSPWVTYDL